MPPRCSRPTSTSICPRARSPFARPTPATRRACWWSERRAGSWTPRCRPAFPAAPRRRPGVQRYPGDPCPAHGRAPARARRARRSTSPCSSRWTRRVGPPSPAPPSACAPGDRVRFPGLEAVVERRDEGEVDLAFDVSGEALEAAITAPASCRCRPTSPPVARRTRGTRRTIRPSTPGRARRWPRPPPACISRRAALARWRRAGVSLHFVTLHVGAGTFLPVKAERLADHRMHAEWGEVTPKWRARWTGVRARAGGSSAWAPPACACSKARRARTAAARPFAARPTSSSRPVIDSKRPTD